jgi:hypothetical protein
MMHDVSSSMLHRSFHLLTRDVCSPPPPAASLSLQSNPAGEGYALQKVMGSNHPTLRSVFLHYAQLERSLGEHWPPVMTYVQWLVFAKETRISGEPGARGRRTDTS